MARRATTIHPPGGRRNKERRKKDGLGLLPRATTPSQRLIRERINRLIGFLLIIGGVLIVGRLIPAIERGKGSYVFVVVLAPLVIAQGVNLIGRRERRRTDRRKIRYRQKP